MKINRLEDAVPYDAPGHFDMRGLRLQGWDMSDAANFWVGFSQFLPNGGAEKDASPLEKVYVVLEGEITIIKDGTEYTLKAHDSCHIDPHEAREIINKTNLTATMLVIMPYPKIK